MTNAKLKFSKFQGAGNDFVIVDLRDQKVKLSTARRKMIAIAACDRHFGIGADGLLFLEKPKMSKNNFRWDFYNQDGSKAEMCLNASRCVTLFECQKKNKTTVRFETARGVLVGKKINSNIQVETPLINSPIQKMTLKNIGSGYLVQSGVPHFVSEGKTVPLSKIREKAKLIRNHRAFGKNGTNATFFEKSKNKILAITLERGVEDFTLACGTGAAAVGIYFAQRFAQNKTTVDMPGGKLLITVDIQNSKLKILGPAKNVFEGILKVKI